MRTTDDPVIAPLLAARGGFPLPAAVALPPLEVARRYMIFRAENACGGRAIACMTCGWVSHHPDDVLNLYCGHCRTFHPTAALDAAGGD